MKILFCCGGTFGHIAPALAAAEAMRERYPEAEIVFAGRKEGAENNAIRREGYALYEIPIESIDRRLSIKSALALFDLFSSLREARRLLDEIRPSIVFGTGGYVCFPLIREAQAMGIPTVLHESNATPGRACRILARRCEKVLIGMRDCAHALPRHTRCEYTGNPVRQEFFRYTKEKARRILGIPADTKFLLSFGGSGGARCLNEAILSFMAKRAQKRDDFFHVHAVGKKYYEDAAKRYPALTVRHSRYRIYPYIENMPLYMRAADLCICRSGAMTLAELAATETPSILIPSPNVTNDHQYKNARSFADAGGALLLEEGEIGSLEDRVFLTLVDEGLLASMRASLAKCCEKDGATRIVDSMFSILP